MSSSRSGRILTARPSFLAAIAASAANRLPCVSLPPKPPPMRRISTVTACDGTPSACADHVLHLARMLGRGIDGDVLVLAGHRPWRSGLRGRNAPGRRSASGPSAGAAPWRSPPPHRRASSVSGGVTSLPPAASSSRDVDDRAAVRWYSIFASRQARRACSRVSAITQKIGWPWNCDLAVGEHRLVMPAGRADVVLAGNVLGGQHVDDAGRGAHRRQIDRRDRRACATVDEAEAAMQRAGRLRHVVDVDRPAPTHACARNRGAGRCATPPAIFSAFEIERRVLVHRALTPPAATPAAAPWCRWSRRRSAAAGCCAGQRPVFGRGAHVGQRREVRGEGGDRRLDRRFASTACRSAPPRPPSRASASPPCRHRRCGSPPPCRPCRASDGRRRARR